MKKALLSIRNKTGLLTAIVLAALVGGVTSAIVSAAIPDSGGQIHGCYRTGFLSNGALRIIDSPSASCNFNETPISWSQGGGGNSSGAPILKDANSQIIGSIVGFSSYLPNSSYASDGGIHAYNQTLKRIIPITYSPASNQLKAGQVIVPVFETINCTGQAYIGNDPVVPAKTTLLRWTLGAVDTTATVTDSASVTSIIGRSIVQVSGSNPPACIATGDESVSAGYLPLTPTSLPFTVPIATPLKF